MFIYMPRNIAKKPLFRKRHKQPAKKKTTKPSRSFRQKVLKIVHKEVETKQAFNTLSLTPFNSGMTSQGDVLQVIPSINKGTSDNQRIGDQLRAMSLQIRGYILASISIPQALSQARIGVRIMVVQPKEYSNYSTVYANYNSWQVTLLKKGGTTSAFTGAVDDLYAPINSDSITKYYDKVIYVTTPYIYTGTGTTNVNVIQSMDVAQSVKFFNIKFNLRNKLLKYDDSFSSGLAPTNTAPVMMVGYVHLDGSSPDIASTNVSMQYDAIFNYEDA